MGRPRGVATERKEFRLEARQVRYLEALIATATLGKPTLVSLVRQAVDELIRRELSKADARARVESFLRQRRKVVNLRDVKREK